MKMGVWRHEPILPPTTVWVILGTRGNLIVLVVGIWGEWLQLLCTTEDRGNDGNGGEGVLVASDVGLMLAERLDD